MTTVLILLAVLAVGWLIDSVMDRIVDAAAQRNLVEPLDLLKTDDDKDISDNLDI